MTNLFDRTIGLGDRIDQALFIKKANAEFEEVSSFNDFQTDSDSKGFGSSGK